MGRLVVVRAWGHPEIRATHGNTLELTRETVISARATCVVGVGAELAADELGLLRGPVRISVEAAGRAASGTAVVNPGHRVRDRFVVRRSGWSDVDTLAVASSITAENLDAELVAALTDPGTAVTVTIEETGAVPPLVLLTTGAAWEGRLALLAENARSTVDLGRLGRGRLPLDGLGAGATVVARLPSIQEPGAGAWLAAAAERGARFAGGGDLWPVPALAAAGLPPAPAVWLGAVGKREVRDPAVAEMLAAAPVPVVCEVPVADAPAVAERIAAAEPEHRVGLGDEVLDVGIAVVWVAARDIAATVAERTDETVTVVVPPRPGDMPRVEVGAVVRALAAAGVPPRTLSEALAPWGVSRRQIYDATARPGGGRDRGRDA